MPTIRVDRETFLDTLRQSGLVSGNEFRKVVRRLDEVRKPRHMARALVDWGLLTKFQAELLLIGRGKGFFLGPYKILDQLGQGGMGRVYKALHQTMNRTVALKVLAPHLVKTPKAQKLFMREVQAAAQLNHPNIVVAYDANEIGGRHYLAMEYVDGPNLEQLVREQGTLPIEMACEIIRQAANGLQHAFEQGMIHRDIKPANLLLQPSRTLMSFLVKILDFGLARLNDPGVQDTAGRIETKDNTVMGTPDFLSPEQSRSLHLVDIRSDIYSLGCTFYFLLTGKVPFPGGKSLDKLIRHNSEEPRALEEFRQDVPEQVLAIVNSMMAKSPAVRPQTPQDVATALVPHARACAPTWDDQVRRVSGFMNSTTPEPKGDDAEPRTPPGEMVGTLPAGLSPTPLAGSGENPLPWVDGEPAEGRSHRKAYVWALVLFLILTGVTVTLILLEQ